MSKQVQQKYTRKELFGLGPQRVYKDQYLDQISFPLGGIGTGCIGLSGRGSLQDFEIFNHPNKGSKFERTFAMIRMKAPNKEPICRVLEGPVPRPYTPLDGGKFHANGEGYPHMDRCEFRGEYPFAWIDFFSEKLPLKIKLEAYNPFIPSEADSSSIPCAIFKYNVTNQSQDPVDVSIAWSIFNFMGWTFEDCQKALTTQHSIEGSFLNTYMEEKPSPVRGLLFTNLKFKENEPMFGSMALTTPDEGFSYTPYWKDLAWFISHYAYWNQFKEKGSLEICNIPLPSRSKAGAIVVKKTLKPGETQIFTFYLTWYVPNFVKYWGAWNTKQSEDKRQKWKNFYAKFYENAFEVATKLHTNEMNYYQNSKKFHDALFGSTLPPYVIDAVASNMSILKSPTCIRLEDGTFYGWEGCDSSTGCCEGSCTHVWGYQQALPFLFPSLERSMHDANYKYNFMVEDVGALEFRIQLPPGSGHGFFKPCADGQMGGVMHVYREWKLCGDDNWLRSVWPYVKRALEFAFEDWDEERSGVLKSFQHNTYDVDFWGPNPMLTCYYLGALLVGAEMARFLGDEASAKLYLEIHENGRKWVDANLFNGEYFIQLYDPKAAKDWQVGTGCLVDQLVGQELARIIGKGNFLDDNHIKSALKSIFKYNWKPNMREHENGARLYAVNDEAAVLICTWPKGGRPEVPFPYADEVMNGFEYQFAVHCIYEDLLEEGLVVAKSIRDRYDGWGRNPWDEFECGHHYARSMASYGLLIALSGFEYDKRNGFIGFNPKIYAENFRTFWSIDNVWGNYIQTPAECKIEVLYGKFSLRDVKIPQFANKSVSIQRANKKISIAVNEKGLIHLPEPIELLEGHIIQIESAK